MATIQKKGVRGDDLGFAGSAVARSVLTSGMSHTNRTCETQKRANWDSPPYQYCGKLDAMTSSSKSKLGKTELEYILMAMIMTVSL